jgi:hypothetical protein
MAALTSPVWHVWVEGGDPVGPVSADQIARGIQAGKVPRDASVRHEADVWWSDIHAVPDLVAALEATNRPSAPPASGRRPALTHPQFMVWIPGTEPVGPVSADQVARGIRAGKVRTSASIQRIGDLFSSRVLDEPDVVRALNALNDL